MIVPADAVAPKVTVPAPHLEPGVTLDMVGVDLMVTTVPDEVAEQLAPVDTVMEYVPPVVTVIVWVVPPPGLHKYVPVVALELNVELPQLLTTVKVGVVGIEFTVMESVAETAPLPQVPVPFTVKSPEVADAEKSMVT